MKNIIAIIVLAVLMIGIVCILRFYPAQTLGNIKAGTTTSYTSVSVTASPTLIFASSTGTQYRSITNVGANMSVVCSATSTGVVYGVGRIMTPSSTIELIEEEGSMWCTDPMWGASAGTSSAVVQSR